MTEIGKAYGFFDCDVTKGKIEELLPIVRSYAQTPSDLKHYLVEGMDNLGDVPDSISEFGKNKGFKYALKAELPNASNKETADEVGHILNQVYQSPLFKDSDPFSGEVVHEDNGKLVFMD